MTIKEQYAAIASKNKSLLEKVISYGCNTLNNTREEFLGENLKMHIKELLKTIRTNNQKVVNLRLERARVREDLEDMERAFCGSPGGDLVPQGKNTGGKPNNIETRQLEKLKLKELLGQLVVENRLLEKSLEEHNNLIAEFMNLIPRKNYNQVLKMTYIDCMSNTNIACEMYYTTEFVNKARLRGIIDLVQIMKCMI